MPAYVNSDSVGYLIGPQTFKSNQAPKYTGGVIGMLVCFAVSILLLLIYWAVAFTQNRIRDRRTGPVAPTDWNDEVTAIEVFVDQTDKEQENFRYTT